MRGLRTHKRPVVSRQTNNVQLSVAFDERVRNFLSTPKTASRNMRWKSDRVDYARASFPVFVQSNPQERGHVFIMVHMYRIPQKCSFSLVYKNTRIIALDVEPATRHTNLRTLEIIFGTHWQIWPDMDAVIDKRARPYLFWLDEFLKRANVHFRYRRKSPPLGVQERLPFL